MKMAFLRRNILESSLWVNMIKYILSATTFIAVLLIYFQNCANDTTPFILATDYSSMAPRELSPLPIDHPPEKTVDQTKIKYQVANRDYVIDLMTDIFSDDNGVAISELDGILNVWVFNRGSQYGLGCDNYASASGRDCYLKPTESNLPVYTVRESFQIQLCENILSLNHAVTIVKSKVAAGVDYPNRESLINLYNLFYRGNDPNENVINTLLDFDRALAQNRESQLERWRGVILQVCESPGWQLF